MFDLATAPKALMKIVPVPEWGITVHIRMLGADDLDTLEIGSTDEAGKFVIKGYRVKYLSKCLTDEAGALLYDSDAARDWLETWGHVVERLFLEARQHHGWKKDADLKN